jgi:hypothetical protein
MYRRQIYLLGGRKKIVDEIYKLINEQRWSQVKVHFYKMPSQATDPRWQSQINYEYTLRYPKVCTDPDFTYLYADSLGHKKRQISDAVDTYIRDTILKFEREQ